MSAKPPTRRLSAARRREDMIEFAQEVFLRQGYNGARTRDIAEAAGVSEAIIYRHFNSKEELFEAAVIVPLEEHLAVFSAWTNDFALVTNRERLKRSLQIHEHAFAVMADIVPLFGVAIFADGDAGKTFYRKRIAPLIDRGATVMAHSLEPWPETNIDPGFLFRAIFGIYLAVTLDANMRDEKPNAAELAARLTEFLSSALSAPPHVPAGQVDLPANAGAPGGERVRDDTPDMSAVRPAAKVAKKTVKAGTRSVAKRANAAAVKSTAKRTAS